MSDPPATPPRCLAISRGEGSDLESWFRSLAPFPGITVLIREKGLDDRALYELGCSARAALPRHRVLLHGRWDLARAAGADGVHLASDGLPAAALRRHLGKDFWIGVSTHTLREIRQAEQGGATYAVFGPVYPTPGKGEEALTGLGGLEAATQAGGAELPVLGLGGLEPEHFAAVRTTGSAGVAGIRAFQRPEDLSRWAAILETKENLVSLGAAG